MTLNKRSLAEDRLPDKKKDLEMAQENDVAPFLRYSILQWLSDRRYLFEAGCDIL